MRFAKWVFTGAGIYGLIVLLPLYVLESTVARTGGAPINYAEYYYGFTGTAVAFQIAFLIIGRDPIRYRPLMLAAVVEKWTWGPACWVLAAQHRVQQGSLFFSAIDFVLGALFLTSWFRTAKAASAA